MSSHPARRLAAVAGTGAVLAALLAGGGNAAASQPDPAPTCAQALQALTTAQNAAAVQETDGSDSLEEDGSDTQEADGSDKPDGASDETDGAEDETDGAADEEEGAPTDTDDVADLPDPELDPEGNADGLDGEADELEEDGSDETDGAEDELEDDGSDAPEDDGSDTPETDGSDAPEADESSDATPAQRAAVTEAKRIADEACKGAQGNPGKPGTDGVNASVVVCVLRPGTCAEVKVDTEGRLIEIVREIQCNTERLPTGTVRKGEKVVTVNRQVITDPGSYSYELPSNLPSAPAPTIVRDSLPVTH